uniref:Putative triabin-like lipocalin 4a n=1 Tax=Panstrongylus lignarius TaxID=156445 RepID=A0A224XPR6_9HEMI
MKIILSLTFVATLTLAFAATVEQQGCLNVQAKEKFEPRKYFKGTWYLTNVQKTLSSPTDLCRESKSDVLEDGTVVHKVYGYSDKKTPEFAVTECTTNLKEITGDLGKVPLHCKAQTADKLLEFDFEGTVLETDYDHFAVFYACGKSQNKEIGNCLVLNRDKNGDPTDSRVVETLKKHGLDLSNFVSRKNVHCKEHPDTVNN